MNDIEVGDKVRAHLGADEVEGKVIAREGKQVTLRIFYGATRWVGTEQTVPVAWVLGPVE